MKSQKVSGSKTYAKGKQVAVEDLPGRCGFGYATITGGDLMKRMGNFYGKNVINGDDQPSSESIFTMIGRRIGMA